jgi:TRAP-type C4-dicarboxylate transport system permease small subunit
MRQKIDKVLEHILVALMAINTLDVLWGVFTRYVMGAQASWSEELARFLLIWIGILGAAWASGKNMHLAIDLFPSSLDPVRRRKLYKYIDVLIIIFAFFVMVIGGARLVYVTFILGQVSAALQLPLAWVYIVLPISGLLVIYYKADDLLNNNPQPTEAV